MSANTTVEDPADLGLDDRLGDTDYVQLLFDWDNLIYLVLIAFCISLAKFTYTLPFILHDKRLVRVLGEQEAAANAGVAGASTAPAARPKYEGFSLDEQLTNNDNKAVAASFAAYIISIGFVLNGVLIDTPDDVGLAIMHVLVFLFLGFVFTFLSSIINDKFVTPNKLNALALVEGNLATALVEAGGFLASGLINGAVQVGGDRNMAEGIAKVAFFWALGMFFFVLFAFLYRLTAGFDVYEQVQRGNAAAGLGYGLTLTALGLLISNPLSKSDSLLAFAIMFLLGTTLLLAVRFLVDKFILPGEALKREIVDDENWGAALLEGVIAVGSVLCLNTFLRWNPCVY